MTSPAKNSINLKTAIIDGYLDEPSCLGVPPYISPHVRYTYGALIHAGVSPENIDYWLIDQIRQEPDQILARLQEKDLVIIIAGTTVPGRYLRGRPASLREIATLGESLAFPTVILGGPITLSLTTGDIKRFQLDETIDSLAGELVPLHILKLLSGKESLPVNKDVHKLIKILSIKGAGVTKQHPDFPNIVCEIETFRGCPRPVNCSFCSERLKKITYCRLPEDVIEEVSELYRLGNRYFRLGCQTDLIAYGGIYQDGIFKPNPDFIKQLYTGIRAAAPDLKVLHMDNANPATIAKNPSIASEILKVIASCNTPGDIAAFGMESADPVVLKKNNIDGTVDKVYQAIKLMNTIGGKREDGIPKLLPGLNFLHGLKGETPQTMELNLQFLQKVLHEDLLLRRINIRQVQEIQNYKGSKINKYKFQKYKEKVNKEINLPMLKKVFPAGTILRDVLLEKVEGKLSYGRQLGTYPILVGIPGEHPTGEFRDVIIIDHGYRSITGLVYPFNINRAGLAELEALPGIGKKRAMRIFMSRPVRDLKHLNEILDKSYNLDLIKEWIRF